MPGLPEEPVHSDPDRVARAVAALRTMSAEADPGVVTKAFWQGTHDFFPFDRTVSVSRRGLPPHQYRVTSSDVPPEDATPAAVLSGGLLGELVWAGRPRLIHDPIVASDDPAGGHLAGMRCLAALPHFDDGEPVDMIVHLWNDRAAFDERHFAELLLLSGLFGRAVHGLVVARDLLKTQESLADRNRIMADLSDVVIDQARQLKRHADDLEQRVLARTADLDAAHDDAVFMLALASEQKDHATGDHVRRVESLTRRLAARLGFDADAAAAIGRASILHDVGKLHVPDAILQKPEPLSPEERAIMQEHAKSGERILGDRPAFAVARRIARWHHEDWAGTGYPDGLAGEAIPVEARIVHVVDVYDALVNARPYKNAWAVDAALRHMNGQAGTMFDPRVIAAFADMLAARS